MNRSSTTAVGAGLVVTTAVAPVLWGMTYLVTTELLPAGRPLLASCLRALSAGVVLVAVAPRRPRGVWWIKATVLGVLNIGAFFVLLFVAAYRLPGGVAAMLGSVQPLVAATLAVVLRRERIRPRIVVAGLLGVVGVALLVLRAGATLDAVGVGAGLAGAVSMSTGIVLTKRWGQPVPIPSFTSWQLVAGGLVLAPLVILVEGAPQELSTGNVVGFGWFAATTALAYLLWFRGVAGLPVARVSLLALLSPIVATLAGWVALDQALTPAQVAGAALVLVAISVGQRAARVRTSRRRTGHPAPRPLREDDPTPRRADPHDLPIRRARARRRLLRAPLEEWTDRRRAAGLRVAQPSRHPPRPCGDQERAARRHLG